MVDSIPDDELGESLGLDFDLLLEANRHHGCPDLLHFGPLEAKIHK